MKEIIGIVVIIVFMAMLSIFANGGIKKFKENYTKPDTTMIYQNGRWDTIIKKKSLPAWLK